MQGKSWAVSVGLLAALATPGRPDEAEAKAALRKRAP
jgi:hypothetical protein